MKKIIICFLVILSGSGIFYATTAAKESEKVIIKIATLAPKATFASKIAEELINQIKGATNNRIDVKFYWGGVQGDDNNVIGKIRLKNCTGEFFLVQSYGK